MKLGAKTYVLGLVIIACLAVTVWRMKPRPGTEVTGLPPATPQEVASVAARTTDPDPLVARQAVIDIGRMKARKESPRLVAALRDKRPDIREAAATSLGWVAAWDAIPALLQTMDDKDVMVRLAAHHAIVRIIGIDYGFPAAGPRPARLAAIARIRAHYQECYPGYLDWMKRRGVDLTKENGS